MFFDASVLVAASRSPSGGSAVALEVCGGHTFRGAVSMEVLAEARVNVARKFGDAELVRFYRQLAALAPDVVAVPTPARIAQCVPHTTEKDAHILAAALDCNAAYLLTLDRRHLLSPQVLGAGLPLQVMTPGEFLQTIIGPSR